MKNILIEEYISLIIKWGEFQENHFTKKSNMLVPKIQTIRDQIKENIHNYTDELLFLLNHENDYVKVEIASILLESHTKEAVDSLKSISSKRGLVSAYAMLTLRAWEKENKN